MPSTFYITHNSDAGIPGKYAKYLEDDKLIAWLDRMYATMNTRS